MAETWAPWSDEQCRMLDQWQQSRQVHPFTCANRDDGNHRVTSDLGVLVPTNDGWRCPDCDYTQGWAHDFMLKPIPDWSQK